MPDDGGGTHVEVKKRQRQDVLRFRADAQKRILGYRGIPLDHLSAIRDENLLLEIGKFSEFIFVRSPYLHDKNKSLLRRG